MDYIKYRQIIVLSAITLLLISCRGEPFDHQPIHPIPNMDQQRRFEAQEVNPFFKDDRAMRQPVNGTISRGNLKTNTRFYEGKTQDGSFVKENPVTATKSFLYRGKDRYEVYCAPCHGLTGDGKGIIMTGNYGYVPAPSYHTDRLRNMPEGQLYSAIKNGIRTMPGYGSQVSVRDRWAIVAYIRALQKSQNATAEQVRQHGVSTDSLVAASQEKQKQQAAKQKAQAEKPEAEVSVERGKTLFTQNACGSCHSTDGSSGVGPTLKGLYNHEVSLQSGQTITADEEYIKESILKPKTKIVKGYQPVMPNIASSLSESDVQSLVEYIKTLE